MSGPPARPGPAFCPQVAERGWYTQRRRLGARRGAPRRGVAVAEQGPVFCFSCRVRSPLGEFPVSEGSETRVSVGFSGAGLKPARGHGGRDSRPRLGVHCAVRPAGPTPPPRPPAAHRRREASAGPRKRRASDQGGRCFAARLSLGVSASLRSPSTPRGQGRVWRVEPISP